LNDKLFIVILKRDLKGPNYGTLKGFRLGAAFRKKDRYRQPLLRLHGRSGFNLNRSNNLADSLPAPIFKHSHSGGDRTLL